MEVHAVGEMDPSSVNHTDETIMIERMMDL